MQRIPVQSSNIKSIGYDTISSILEVEFFDSRVYQYFNVPPFIFDSLMNSASKGEFLNQNIRFHYRYQKIS